MSVLTSGGNGMLFKTVKSTKQCSDYRGWTEKPHEREMCGNLVELVKCLYQEPRQ